MHKSWHKSCKGQSGQMMESSKGGKLQKQAGTFTPGAGVCVCVCVLVVAVMMLSEVMHGHLVGHVMLVWAEVRTLRIGSRLILVLETGLLGWETGEKRDEK